MRISTLTAAAVLTLGVAMPLSAQAQTPAEPYRAAGDRPAWTLTIDGRTMRFETPGRAPVSVAMPRVIHGFAGEIYQTRRVNVNLVHNGCRAGGRDAGATDGVTVRVDGRTYHGCGGAVAAASLALLEGSWTIESIDSRRVRAGTHPEIRFEGKRISGDSGCNRFMGDFTFARGQLTAGPLGSTRRMCADRGASAQEAEILRVLGQPLRVSRNRAGKLVLSGRGGKTLVLAPKR
ncbi:META domain-containing protein [Sphingomonas sp. CJ20]